MMNINQIVSQLNYKELVHVGIIPTWNTDEINMKKYPRCIYKIHKHDTTAYVKFNMFVSELIGEMIVNKNYDTTSCWKKYFSEYSVPDNWVNILFKYVDTEFPIFTG